MLNKKELDFPESASVVIELSTNKELSTDENTALQTGCNYEGVYNIETAMFLFVTHLADIAERARKDVGEICMIAEQIIEDQNIKINLQNGE